MANMRTMQKTMGEIIAAARASEGMPLRTLGAALGVSAPYLHDVEHDRRRLAVVRWAALLRALPSLNLTTLAEASLATGPVEIDASALTREQRKALVAAIVAMAKEGGK